MTWRKKLFFSVLVTATFFIAIEGALALLGVRPVTVLRDPLVGFSSVQPLLRPAKSETGEVTLRTASNKLVWFNDQTISVPKPPNTIRIACLGGSTTYGRPYWDATSYAGWMRQLLPLVDPSSNWEVINAGGISYASYRVALVMEELADHDVDLFVIYTAHNEFLERRTYGDLMEKSPAERAIRATLAKTRSWAFLDQAANRWHKGTPSSEINLLPAEVDERLNHTIGPSDYHRDDRWRSGVLGHFETNLHRMVQIARNADADVVFITPASNLKDCSPFKSEPSQVSDDLSREPVANVIDRVDRLLDRGDFDVALQLLESQPSLDPRHADLQFRIGKAFFASGRYAEAEAAFERAVEEDVCPLRAIGSTTEAIRRVGLEHRVPLVDFEQLLLDRCRREYGHRCLGKEYFLDHVHPTIEIHQQLALWIIESLQQNELVGGKMPSAEDIQQASDRINQQIDSRAQGVALRNLAKVLHWSGKFREALPRADDALNRIQDDPESLWVAADCLAHTNRVLAARSRYERLFRVAPDYVKAYLPYGELLVRQGEYSAARGYLTVAAAHQWQNPRAFFFLGIAESGVERHELAIESLRRSRSLDPTNADVLYELGAAYAAAGRPDEAIQAYESSIALDDTNAETHYRLGMLLLRQRKPEQATKHFEASLRLDPSHVSAKESLQVTAGMQSLSKTSSGQSMRPQSESASPNK